MRIRDHASAVGASVVEAARGHTVRHARAARADRRGAARIIAFGTGLGASAGAPRVPWARLCAAESAAVLPN